MKKLLLMFVAICFCICGVQGENRYQFVPKMRLVYEILNVSKQETGYVIEGWAFINESQHMRSAMDVSGSLRLKSIADEIILPLEFYKLDMTYLMKMEGRRRCKDTEYNQPANICYYDYEYVGFRVFIPFDSLKDNQTYTLQLMLHAKKADIRYMLDIFFVQSVPTVKYNERFFTIRAKLDSTSFYVNHNYVLARKEPSKFSAAQKGTDSCSAQFGNVQYFQFFSQFTKILEQKQVDFVNWFRIMTKEFGCVGDKLEVVQGDTFTAWIPSTFIEFNGIGASIEVHAPKAGPSLTIENPTIYLGDMQFNPDDYVSAFDKTDGELIPLRGITNLNRQKVGKYLQLYSATNSQGLKTQGTMIITVIDKPNNTPPRIFATNKTVYQYSSYDALAGVEAIDLEDGDLRKQIQIMNNVNTSILGIQQQCFYVKDSGGLDNQVCIQVRVIAKPLLRITELRFLDQRKPFYKQSIPAIWQGRYYVIQQAINSKTPMIHRYLD